MSLPPFPRRTPTRASTAISAPPAAPPIAETAEIAAEPTQPSAVEIAPRHRREPPQSWLSALALVRAQHRAGPPYLPPTQARLSWLERFVAFHAADLHDAAWTFDMVFRDVLDERCEYDWRGDFLELLAAFPDRLRLQLDDRRFTIYRTPAAAEAAAASPRPERYGEPPQIRVDHSSVFAGPRARERRVVALAAMFAPGLTLATMAELTCLSPKHVHRVVDDLQRARVLGDDLTITHDGWSSIERDLPDFAHIAAERLKSRDDDVL